MSSENPDQFEGQKVGLVIFDCFMSVFWLGFGLILLFASFLKLYFQIADGARIGLGVLFVLYGLFRVTKAAMRILHKNR